MIYMFYYIIQLLIELSLENKNLEKMFWNNYRAF
jgi:hypothetical protein